MNTICFGRRVVAGYVQYGKDRFELALRVRV